MDKAGQAVSATAGDGSTTLANYDPAGRLIQIQPPGGLNYTLGSSLAGRATGFAPPMVEEDAFCGDVRLRQGRSISCDIRSGSPRCQLRI